MPEEDLKKPWPQRAREDLEAEKVRLIGENGDGGECNRIRQEIQAESQRDMRAYSPNMRLHSVVLSSYVFVQIILAAISGAMIAFVEPVSGINFGLLILLLQLAHAAGSLKSVKVDDLAGTTFFGRPTSMPEPGLILVPLFLMRLHVISRNYKDYRVPGPADKILRLSATEQADREYGDIPTPEQASQGLVRPIIVVSGHPRLSDKEKRSQAQGLNVDPFDERNTFEIAYIIRYRPDQEMGGIFRLIRNVGLPAFGTSLEKALESHLRENSERDIKAILARHTLATTIANQTLLNEVFAYRLLISMMRLAIQIDPNGTGLDDINPSHRTNEAQADARRARFKRQQKIIDADGERERIIREGRGTAEAERLLLEARAAGFKKIKTETGVDGTVVIASETARNFKDANTIFGAQGIKEVLAMSDLFSKKQPEEQA